VHIRGDYFVFDMNSTNGTFVNNQKILKHQLQPGDVVTMGATQFRFAMEEAASVGHIATIFKRKDAMSLKDHRTSVVDSLIETELSTATANTQIFLEVVYHDGNAEDFTLNQRVIYLGRASSFGKFDKDPEISRKHLLIKLNDSGEIFIEDQGTTNGTSLNGQIIQGMHQISPGDVVQIGLTKIRVRALQAAA
jgi:pSer/pThr/pTyr-binding forkhead associated (FHA) protein